MNDKKIVIYIDIDQLPDTIVPIDNLGNRDYELEHLPLIKTWIDQLFPSYDPAVDCNTTAIVKGDMPGWLTLWIGLNIEHLANDIKYKPVNIPSFYLKRGSN